jgi:YbbR domain-containing protein
MPRLFSIVRVSLLSLSLLFALVIWGFVTLRFEYFETFSVPLVVQNLRPGFAIRSPLPRTVLLRIHGSGWRIGMMKIAKPPECTIDLSSVNREITVSLEKYITKVIALPSDVQVVDIFPESLTITLDGMAQKKIPVAPHCNIKFRDGYIQVGKIDVQPESITISGARSIVDTITEWATKEIILTDLHVPVRQDVALIDTTEVPLSLSQSKVLLGIDVQPFAEKILQKIPVDISAVPSNRQVLLFPPLIDVVVRGGISQLASVQNDEISAAIYYRSILIDTSGSVRPEIKVPKGLTLVTSRPDRIEYVIRKK